MVLFAIAQIPCYYRPLFFFGRLAILFASLSLLFATPALDDWIRYRCIYHIPYSPIWRAKMPAR
jgi:hypothetical protein